MIKIDNINYGIMPYGPGSGNQMLSIYFKDDESGNIDLSGLDEKKDFDKIKAKFTEVANNLYDSIKNIIKENKLEDQWQEAMVVPKLTYIGLTGNVLIDDTYFYPYMLLLDLISQEAVNKQRLLHEANQKVNLEAPHFTLIADTMCPFIHKNPYEACNFVIGRLNVKRTLADGTIEEINDTNKKDFFLENSLMNINNHPFGCYVFRPKSEADLNLFDKYICSKWTFSHPSSVFIVPVKATKSLNNACIEYALKHKFRVNNEIISDKCVNFEY